MADTKISALPGATTPLDGTELVPLVQSSTTKKTAISSIQAAPVAAGTANGVQYLNASKVPSTTTTFTYSSLVLALQQTTNSAFTVTGFNSSYGASTKWFGGATANPLHIGQGYAAGNDGIGYIFNVANAPIKLGVNNTEVGSITSSGVAFTAAKGVNFTANTPAAGMTSQLLNWYEEGTWTPAYSATGLSGVTYLIQQGTYTRIGRAVYIVFYIATSGTFTSGSSTVTITGLPFTSASTNTSHVGFANATRWATAPVSGRISSSTTSINIYSAFNGTGPGTDPVALTGSGMTSGDGGNNNIIQASAMYFV